MTNITETLNNILDSPLMDANLRYCLITSDKRPYRVDNEQCKPNNVDDFVEFSELVNCTRLSRYSGVGISIQASDICAIDCDDCFKTSFEVNSADDRAKALLSLFANYTYCEFSFSGHGLRILFRIPNIDNYDSIYYTKNSTVKIEYYRPEGSARYVTVTGKIISNKPIAKYLDNVQTATEKFLNLYMKRRITTFERSVISETKSMEQIKKELKVLIFKNPFFQDLWFSQAPGSGADESERDYHILAILFEQITQDKEILKQIFESSPYFKSKDRKHINKWLANDNRYYNYVYSQLKRKLI